MALKNHQEALRETIDFDDEGTHGSINRYSLPKQPNFCARIHRRRGVHPFGGMNRSTLVNDINYVLTRSRLQLNIPRRLDFRVAGLVFMPTGGASIISASEDGGRWLKENLWNWAPLVDRNIQNFDPSFNVVIKDIPVGLNPESVDFRKRLCAENDIKIKEIHDIEYSSDSLGGSMMISTAHSITVKRLENKGLRINGEVYKAKDYKAEVVQCEHCQTFGHHYTRCFLKTLCGKCGREDHWTAQCTAHGPPPYCFVCQRYYQISGLDFDSTKAIFRHPFNSLHCPTNIRRIANWNKNKNQ